MSDQPTVAAESEIEHLVTAWDEALGAKDLDAAMALYQPDCVLESGAVRVSASCTARTTRRGSPWRRPRARARCAGPRRRPAA